MALGVPYAGRTMLDSFRKRLVLDLLVAARLADEVVHEPARSASEAALEQFAVCLGMQLRPGPHPDDDDLVLHECGSALAIAVGAEPRRALRYLRDRDGRPCTCGKDEEACGAWPDGVPLPAAGSDGFAVAPGLATTRKRRGCGGMVVVTANLASAGDRDFRNCLAIAGRPGEELPILAVLLDPTGAGARAYARRVAQDCGVACVEAPGGDLEACWAAVGQAIETVRVCRRPALLVAWAERTRTQAALALEDRLVGEAALSRADGAKVWTQWRAHLDPCRKWVGTVIDGGSE